jgi:DNA-binding NtrC family response regulator
MLMRVLVIEDEALVALDVATILEDAQLDVAQAATVESALQQINFGGIDTAVLDALIRGTWAIPVAQALERCRIPYIVYSNFHQDQMSDWAHPVQFLRKPAPDRVLISAVNNALAQSKPKD